MHKNTIEGYFSEAVKTYDSVADIQMQSSQTLVSMIDNFQIRSVIDIGCGTGNTSLVLLKKYPAAEYTLCDISSAMLERAAEKFSGKFKLLHADAETYDFLNNSQKYDLGIANLSMQWFENIPNFLEKIMQVCSSFAFCTLVSGSFKDYYERFESANFLEYPTTDNILKMCKTVGNIINYKIETYTKFCDNMFAAARYFRKLGAITKNTENRKETKNFINNKIAVNESLNLEYVLIFVVVSKNQS